MIWCHGTCLTYWGQDNLAGNFLTTISNAFSCMKIYILWLTFHWTLLPWVQLTIFQHWFRYSFGAGQATNHNLNQWWLVYWHLYVSLGLSEFTLFQIMACCLTASSRYLKECSHISAKSCDIYKHNFTGNAQDIDPFYDLNITSLRLQPHLTRPVS